MTSQAAKQVSSDRLNGLSTQQLVQTVEALKRDKMLAKFEFRARNEWIDGVENRSVIQNFYGAGAEDESRLVPFTYTSGEPPVLLGANEGANAGEFLLHALAACITSTAVMHATARGIRIESISTELRGGVDLQGALALDPAVSAGFQQITVNIAIKADCADAELDDLLKFVHKHSAVCDTVCRPVPVVLKRA
jgi:uncharacterized OsmC-like protein